MRLHGIDHFTIRCHPDELPMLLAFYTAALGLTPGPRPSFDFAGHWLYADGRALVHLAANDPSPPALPAATGRLDHVSLRTSGLVQARERLDRCGVPHHELPVPGMPLHQLFLRDPTGFKIELTFDAAEANTAPGG
ncbi:MAG: hypothetical protein LCH79_07635 [Proteobacteria bacterium]|jgi:catechol 2,3-dioxygenase-like lactoylglutathione lyase family enzyme|nr:hypothetical protein [Pseudomonadota bacterium]